MAEKFLLLIAALLIIIIVYFNKCVILWHILVAFAAIPILNLVKNCSRPCTFPTFCGEKKWKSNFAKNLTYQNTGCLLLGKIIF